MTLVEEESRGRPLVLLENVCQSHARPADGERHTTRAKNSLRNCVSARVPDLGIGDHRGLVHHVC